MVGRGVKQDTVEAIKWHLLASQNGRSDPKLDAFSSSATKDQKSQARARAKAFGKKK